MSDKFDDVKNQLGGKFKDVEKNILKEKQLSKIDQYKQLHEVCLKLVEFYGPDSTKVKENKSEQSRLYESMSEEEQNLIDNLYPVE